MVYEVRLMPHVEGHVHCVEAPSPRGAIDRLIRGVMPSLVYTVEPRGGDVFALSVRWPTGATLAGNVTVTRGCACVIGSR